MTGPGCDEEEDWDWWYKQNEGENAYRKGKSREDCPYPIPDQYDYAQKRSHWLEGFDRAAGTYYTKK